MTTIPTIADYPSDQPTTEPLVIGPVRGLWASPGEDRRDRITPAGLFVALFLVLPWIGLIESQISERLAAAVGGLIFIMLPGIVLFREIVRANRRGVWGDALWRIDDDGVTFDPPEAAPTFLAWRDVEAVMESEDRLILRSGHVRVRLPLKTAGVGRDEIIGRVQHGLGPGFDLTRTRVTWGPIGDFLKIVAWSVVGFLAFIATFSGPLLIQVRGGPRIAWLSFPIFIVWQIVACLGLRNGCQKVRDDLWIHRRSLPLPIEACS